MSSQMFGARTLRLFVPAAFCLFWAVSANASPNITALVPSLASPQPLGTTITWTAEANDVDGGTLVYQFSTKAPGTTGGIVRAYYPGNSFQLTPWQVEGNYVVLATVRNYTTGKTASKTATFVATSRISGTSPAVYPTNHPLVAQYSAPACPAGATMIVAFKAVGSTAPATLTNHVSCNGATSMNFYVAGMLPNTQYQMSHKLITSGGTRNGPILYFTSGSIPSSILNVTPTTTVVKPPDGQTSVAEGIILNDYIAPGGIGGQRVPTAVDLAGNTVWYYPSLPPQISRYTIKPVGGGNMLIVLDDPSVTLPSQNFAESHLLREFDLAGNTVRETNITEVAREVAALYPAMNICNWVPPSSCRAAQTAILDFHHDVRRLSNGHTLVLMSMEKVFTDGTQGGTQDNPKDVLADMVAELDENMRVVWAWNAYDHLDTHRAAILGETCGPGQGGCPPINFLTTANDWLHTNSVQLAPQDQNIILSLRHQDWLIKIDYAGRTGTVIWRMGDGSNDFTMTGTGDPWPWFSHQHHAGFDGDGSFGLSLFDNGNTRAAQCATCVSTNSRGMVLEVDEIAKTVSPILVADVGSYSFALGTAQRLSNGNYAFGSGFINPGPNASMQCLEYIPGASATGTLNYNLSAATSAYRSYRMKSLYSAIGK